MVPSRAEVGILTAKSLDASDLDAIYTQVI
jgi:hypothetical protein